MSLRGLSLGGVSLRGAFLRGTGIMPLRAGRRAALPFVPGRPAPSEPRPRPGGGPGVPRPGRFVTVPPAPRRARSRRSGSGPGEHGRRHAVARHHGSGHADDARRACRRGGLARDGLDRAAARPPGVGVEEGHLAGLPHAERLRLVRQPLRRAAAGDVRLVRLPLLFELLVALLEPRQRERVLRQDGVQQQQADQGTAEQPDDEQHERRARRGPPRHRRPRRFLGRGPLRAGLGGGLGRGLRSGLGGGLGRRLRGGLRGLLRGGLGRRGFGRRGFGRGGAGGGPGPRGRGLGGRPPDPLRLALRRPRTDRRHVAVPFRGATPRPPGRGPEDPRFAAVIGPP
ncbi:hypothetical protein ACFOY4_17465 [Actinomadura syzygii]|uniref:hypothetical protein n=1 Tax=Actinomadura syzygii TaxID=1427538 RepID=UPI00362154FF